MRTSKSEELKRKRETLLCPSWRTGEKGKGRRDFEGEREGYQGESDQINKGTKDLPLQFEFRGQ
jgi:hypothetical protein